LLELFATSFLELVPLTAPLLLAFYWYERKEKGHPPAVAGGIGQAAAGCASAASALRC
jgi:hypothetical protein